MEEPNSFGRAEYQTSAGQAECRQPIAHEISSLAAAMAEQAERAAIRTDEKLSPICMSSAPVCQPEKGGIAKEYPPFFSDLRDRLLCIERALTKINNVLDRAEI